MLTSYLGRRGKNRYCDKSLGAARLAELLLRVYPKTQFISLYRHPMDVIASGLEACPWGLNGYGFDDYIASTPGNTVLALARFWADNTAATLAAEEKFSNTTIRVRYEDLVADPEENADRIFQFLGVASAPGISSTCFAAERERFGPADHKIWFTSSITADSIGRGWAIPTELIGPQMLAVINELNGKLGYLPVDEEWGTSAPPTDLRLDASAVFSQPILSMEKPSQPILSMEKPLVGTKARRSEALGERLQASLARLTPEANSRWGFCKNETLIAVSVPADPRIPAEHWLVDLKSGTVVSTDRSAREDSDWDVIGSAAVWEQIITDKLNLSVALRSCQLRYCANDEDGSPVIADTQIGILADLLAIAMWRTASSL